MKGASNKDSGNKGSGKRESVTRRASAALVGARDMAGTALFTLLEGAIKVKQSFQNFLDDIRQTYADYQKEFDKAKDAKTKEEVMSRARDQAEATVVTAASAAGESITEEQLTGVRRSLRSSKTPKELQTFIRDSLTRTRDSLASSGKGSVAENEAPLSSTRRSSTSEQEGEVDDTFEEDDDGFGIDPETGTRPRPPSIPRVESLAGSRPVSMQQQSGSASARTSIRDSMQGKFVAGTPPARSSVQRASVQRASVQSASTGAQAAATDADAAQAAHYKITVEQYRDAAKAARITGMTTAMFLSRPNRFTGAGVQPPAGQRLSMPAAPQAASIAGARTSTQQQQRVSAQPAASTAGTRTSMQQQTTSARPASVAGGNGLTSDEQDALVKFERIRGKLDEGQRAQYIKNVIAKRAVSSAAPALKKVAAGDRGSQKVGGSSTASKPAASGGAGDNPMFAEMKNKQLKKGTTVGASPKPVRPQTELERKLAAKRPKDQ